LSTSIWHLPPLLPPLSSLLLPLPPCLPEAQGLLAVLARPAGEPEDMQQQRLGVAQERESCLNTRKRWLCGGRDGEGKRAAPTHTYTPTPTPTPTPSPAPAPPLLTHLPLGIHAMNHTCTNRRKSRKVKPKPRSVRSVGNRVPRPGGSGKGSIVGL